ncbi:hypothetical protein [uncultured Anaerococcus sp.]|uniref:hypothetical protein n=1 Tax=uncultured Anaerococcus sp. TaxID=293428 RepID=UPI00288966FE|nr:hypothetical protein [uncultured Anaerococcus sp.]
MSEKVFVNYIYDSCYSLSYGDYFFVFDYAKGILDIPETKHNIFLVSDVGERTYTEEIFNLGKLKSLNYILNKNVSNLKYHDNIIYLNKDELGMKDLKKLYKTDNVYLLGEGDFLRLNFGDEEVVIKTFCLDGKRLGYFVEIDSLLICYAGSTDLNNIDQERYLDLLDELDEENPDLIFMPITDLSKQSFAYLDKIISDADSQIFFPTKIGNREEESLDFKKFYKSKNTDIRSIATANEKVEIDINSEY